MAEDVRELLVRVSATTELLRSQLTSAERQVTKFEKSTETATRRVENNFNRMGQGVVASAGAQRAGMQQLTMQIGDMATMYALGAKPMQIFASQSAQVIGALQLMSGGASKFATFMGGPWGAAITAGTLILAPWIASLFESDEASKVAENSAKSLAERQMDIANFFDTSTGKIKENSRALIENARAQIYARTLEVQKGQRDRLDQIRSVVAGSKRFVRTGFEDVIDPTGNVMTQSVYKMNTDLISAIRAAGGDRNKVVAAVNDIARSSSPAAADAKQLSDMFAKATLDARELIRLSQMDQSLVSGSLVGALRDPPKGSGTRKRTGTGGRTKKAEKPDEVWDDKWFMNQIAAGVPEMAARIREASGVEFDKFNDRIKNVLQDQQEVREANLKRLADIEARQIDWLAGTYERLFKGGTKAIWGDFKQLGLTVVAQVLAKFTQARLSGKSGFDLSEAVSSSITGALGFGGFFADGGRPPMGKVSIVGERGPELFVPNVAGTIVPNGGWGGGGGVAVTIHAPGATGETVALIRREIAGAIPAIAQAATANTMRQSSRRRL